MAHYYYLFTDSKGRKVEMRECPGLGEEAEEYANKLRKKRKHNIVAWAHMGGENDTPIL